MAQSSHAAPPGQAVNWKMHENFSDEFDGNGLDSSKWYPLNPKWIGRPPSIFSKENVQVKNGQLVILGTKIDSSDPLYKLGARYLTGTVKSQRPIRYGYFEIKAKVAESRISSAFWLYDHSQTTWTEIDVFELCGKPPCSHLYHTNAHARTGDEISGGTVDNEWPEKFRTAELIKDGPIVAGLEWDADWLRWYVDDKLIRQTKNIHWHSPLFLVIDSEVFTKWFGEPGDDELPSKFVVDYVRVWQRAN
jgi:beta-glucanase (GH16 family)